MGSGLSLRKPRRWAGGWTRPHSSALLRSAIRSSASSMPTDRRTRPSSMPSAARTLGRDRGVGHDRRVLDQALDAAEALGEREQLRALEEALRAGEAALELDRDHAAEAVHLAPARARAADGWRGPDRSTRATSGCASSQLRDRQRVARSAAPCAAPASSGRAAPGSCRTGRRSRRPRSAGRRAARASSVVVADDGDAADHVGVAVQVLGRRVHDDVEAELQRPLDVGAGEGVVGDRDQAALRLRERRRSPRGRRASAADWSASRPRRMLRLRA